jgi:hypothetical protein
MNGPRHSVNLDLSAEVVQTAARRPHWRLGLEMRILGYLGLVLAALALCWPESQLFPLTGVPWWIAAASLTLCGVMLVRGGNGLRHAALAPGGAKRDHVSYSRTCFVIAGVFLSPVLLCLAVHLVTSRLHG